MRTKRTQSTYPRTEFVCVFFLVASRLVAQSGNDPLLDCKRDFLRGKQFYDRGELSRAEQSFKSVFAACGQDSGNDSLRGEVLNGLGAVLVEQGRLPEAGRVLSEAVEALRTCSGDRCGRALAKVVHNQGILCMQQNQPFDAERHLNRALALYSRAHAGEPERATVLVSLGWLELDRRRPAAAESYFRRALLGVNGVEEFNRTRALLYISLSGALSQLNRPLDAIQAAQMGLKVASSTPDISSLELVSHSCALARISSQIGDYPLAERTLIHAEEMLETVPEVQPRELAIVLAGFADLRFFQRRYPEALQFQARALDTLRHHLSPDHPQMLTAMENYATMLRKTGARKEAKDVEEELRAARRRTTADPQVKYKISVADLRSRR